MDDTATVVIKNLDLIGDEVERIDFLNSLELHDIHNRQNLDENYRLVFLDESSIVYSDEKRQWQKDNSFNLEEFEETLAHW